MSEPIVNIAGINIKTKIVENSNPKTIVIAIGFKNCACTLVSNSNGVKPPIVVKDVRITALNLSWAPFITAIFSSIPFLILLLILDTIIIESLMTIPDSPRIATKDNIVISKPVIQCPIMTPINVNGIIDMIEMGK